jgi:hypothetical protein
MKSTYKIRLATKNNIADIMKIEISSFDLTICESKGGLS